VLDRIRKDLGLINRGLFHPEYKVGFAWSDKHPVPSPLEEVPAEIFITLFGPPGSPYEGTPISPPDPY